MGRVGLRRVASELPTTYFSTPLEGSRPVTGQERRRGRRENKKGRSTFLVGNYRLVGERVNYLLKMTK